MGRGTLEERCLANKDNGRSDKWVVVGLRVRMLVLLQVEGRQVKELDVDPKHADADGGVAGAAAAGGP